MQKITPHLWFDKEANEAAEFYTSLFPESKITHKSVLRNTPSGDCDLLSFELAGQPFMAISGGPLFKFNPSVSFHVKCGTIEGADKAKNCSDSHVCRFGCRPGGGSHQFHQI